MLNAAGSVSTQIVVGTKRTAGAACCQDADVVDIQVNTHVDTLSAAYPREVRAGLTLVVL